MKLGQLILAALLLGCDPGSPGAQTLSEHEYSNTEADPPTKLVCEADIQEHVPIFCETFGDGFRRRAVYIPLGRTEIREMHRVTELASTPLTLPWLRKNDGTKDGAPIYFWLVNIVALTQKKGGERLLYLTNWSCLDLPELEGLGNGDQIDKFGRSPEVLKYLGIQAPPTETDKEIVLKLTNGETINLPFWIAVNQCSQTYGTP